MMVKSNQNESSNDFTPEKRPTALKIFRCFWKKINLTAHHVIGTTDRKEQ